MTNIEVEARSRGLIFSAAMVQALMAGRKTQTRRLVGGDLDKVKAGDLLYVRESFSGDYGLSAVKPSNWPNDCPIWCWADGNPGYGEWTKPKPSIHMPRKFSRITLLVLDVREQFLRHITPRDIYNEGVMVPRNTNVKKCWADLWNSLHKKPGETWECNPRVKVAQFKVILRNVDDYISDLECQPK